MRLTFVHGLLIGTAIFFSPVLLVHGITVYRARGDVASLWTGIAAIVVAVGLVFYLRWFLRKHRTR